MVAVAVGCELDKLAGFQETRSFDAYSLSGTQRQSNRLKLIDQRDRDYTPIVYTEISDFSQSESRPYLGSSFSLMRSNIDIFVSDEENGQFIDLKYIIRKAS